MENKFNKEFRELIKIEWASQEEVTKSLLKELQKIKKKNKNENK